MQAAADSPAQQLTEQPLLFRGSVRVMPKVVQLVGVGYQVEELTVGLVEEMDQFVSLVADHRHEVTASQDRVAGLLAIDKLSPRERRVGIEGFGEGRRFPVLRDVQPGPLQDRGAQVHLLDEPVDRACIPEPPRRPHDQRHPSDLLVHRPFLTVAVVGQAVAVVAGEDHDRVFQVALSFQRVDDLTNLSVNHRDVGQVIGPLSMPLLGRRMQVHHDRIVVDVLVVLPQLL